MGRILLGMEENVFGTEEEPLRITEEAGEDLARANPGNKVFVATGWGPIIYRVDSSATSESRVWTKSSPERMAWLRDRARVQEVVGGKQPKRVDWYETAIGIDADGLDVERCPTRMESGMAPGVFELIELQHRRQKRLGR